MFSQTGSKISFLVFLFGLMSTVHGVVSITKNKIFN